MEKLKFKVDENKCIHCGLCERDCISNTLKLDENKCPQVVDEKSCIACQHCLAICPAGAISVFDKNPENSEQIYAQNPDMLLNLIKSRRSQRVYKYENVSQEKINKLKEMLKWVPTGCNNHKLHFSFIDDTEVMSEFKEHVNGKIVFGCDESK